MKKFLEEAPLVHAVIHLEFSKNPALSAMTQEISNSLHQRMIEEGFPERIDSQQEVVEFVFSGHNQPPKQKITNVHRTLFRASGEMDVVQVSDHALIIKTTDYQCFEKFHKKFVSALQACIDVVPNFDKVLLKSVGLRYVDLIAPKRGSSLSDYVSSEVLPMSLSMLDTPVKRYGKTFTQAQLNESQVMSVNFEEIPSEQGRVHKVLPDNLIEADPRGGLRIQGHQWWLELDCPTYGILDIDHQYSFVGSPVFDISFLNATIENLYMYANQVFWGTITDTAKQAWKIKNA
ncbi:TIGR04255 family protein [Colwellia piezophila]|uniref:TIGR04255 family protein n=1 Tax=Colwellia piezophila TaxID=211668 RepID=UPI00037F9865|nr:TIGR04255 family protein [Colwellia piezophila]